MLLAFVLLCSNNGTPNMNSLVFELNVHDVQLILTSLWAIMRLVSRIVPHEQLTSCEQFVLQSSMMLALIGNAVLTGTASCVRFDVRWFWYVFHNWLLELAMFRMRFGRLITNHKQFSIWFLHCSIDQWDCKRFVFKNQPKSTRERANMLAVFVKLCRYGC